MYTSPISFKRFKTCFAYFAHKACLFALMLSALQANAEWDPAFTAHQKITLNTAGLTEAVTNAAIPVRLHSGNFDFTSANVDGSDLRFVAADDKTELPYFIEKYDGVNELAIIWVRIPTLVPNDKSAHIWLYSGNEQATSKSSPQSVVSNGATLLLHFSGVNLLQDASPTTALVSGQVTAQKAGLIAESATFNNTPLTVAANALLAAGANYTFSTWVKPTAAADAEQIFAQDDVVLGFKALKLSLKVAGTELQGGDIKAGAWQHVAFTLNAGKVSLYLNGTEVATGNATPSGKPGDITIGQAFVGEMDEVQISNLSASASQIKVQALSGAADGEMAKVIASEDEGDEEGGEANYFTILLDNLTIDAKVVIAILGVMFAISAWVMIRKAMLVSQADADNKRFLARFQKANSADLLKLDQGAKYPNSSLYKLYVAGLREIKKREQESGALSLSGASMDAIKAAIDADLVRETQRVNAGMVLLTIAISGGPFLGLLGTVVGVMITFAAIAAAGDVNVNAIAPGIAAALLATVAGLGVAIPALFGYNYLASRIKNITISMQIFVDEFVTRTAELFGSK